MAAPPPQFLDFPVEILISICRMLCLHCATITTRDDRRYIGNSPGAIALNHLSRTCKTLRSVAQPFLYHAPQPFLYTPLLRTLLARPDLQEVVQILTNRRHLSHRGIDGMSESHGASSSQLNIPDEAAYELGLALADLSASDNAWSYEVLVAHLPGLRQLVYFGHNNQWMFGGSLSSFDGVVFTQLHHLELIPQDPNFRMDDRAWINDMLLARMPNLVSLHLKNLTGMPDRLLIPSVRSLRLTNSCLDCFSIDNLITSCPRLESFEYEPDVSNWTDVHFSSDSDHFTPGDLWLALMTCKATLKHLNIHVGQDSRFVPSPKWLHLRPWRCFMGPLAKFDRLETLVVSTASFDPAPDFPNSEEFVARLPRNVRILTLPGVDDYYGDPSPLAEAIRRGQFPHLKHLELGVRKEDEERVRGVFEHPGVRFMRYPDGFSLREQER